MLPLLTGLGEEVHSSIIWQIFFTKTVLMARLKAALKAAPDHDRREGG